MAAIIIAILIIVIGLSLESWLFNSWRKNIVYDYEEKLAELHKEIESLCILNTLPIIGNFEDDYEPSEERYNEMLKHILKETGIIYQN